MLQSLDMSYDENKTNWSGGFPDNYGYGRYGPSPHSDPEWHGLTLVVVEDWAGDYEFSMVAVWERGGEVRAAYDEGCSCPSPFGDLTWDGMLPIRTVKDLDPLFSTAVNRDRVPADERRSRIQSKVRDVLQREDDDLLRAARELGIDLNRDANPYAPNPDAPYTDDDDDSETETPKYVTLENHQNSVDSLRDDRDNIRRAADALAEAVENQENRIAAYDALRAYQRVANG